jgi:hypothetical protein
MNSTTASTTAETSTVLSAFDQFLFLVQISSISSITTGFFLWGYVVTFLLGFVGNTLSFLTFLRPRLRSVSTGCLFTLLAISDTLYLVICIGDFVEFGLQVRCSKYRLESIYINFLSFFIPM